MAAPQVTTAMGVEDWVGVTNEVGADLGDVSTLIPAANVVAAINVLDSDIGDLTGLDTQDQTSMVNALNEVKNLSFILGLALATPLN